MRVVVFGASGRTGRRIVEAALAAGYEVRAFLRDPSRIGLHAGQRLDPFFGDALERRAVERAIIGQDAVISALGVGDDSPPNLCSEAISRIVLAMTRAEVRRLVVQSAYGARETRSCGLYARALRWIIPALMSDKDRMEAIIRGSTLDWTVVRPTHLTGGGPTGRWKVGTDLRLGLLPSIPRADVAAFMVQQLSSDDHRRELVTITADREADAAATSASGSAPRRAAG